MDRGSQLVLVDFLESVWGGGKRRGLLDRGWRVDRTLSAGALSGRGRMPGHGSRFVLSKPHGSQDDHGRVRRCRRCGIVIAFGERCDVCIQHPDVYVDGPGEHAGRHHSEWVPTVNELIVEGDWDGAESLLWKFVATAEAESRLTGRAPFEGHYQRLAQLAERRQDHNLAAHLRRRHQTWRDPTAADPAIDSDASPQGVEIVIQTAAGYSASRTRLTSKEDRWRPKRRRPSAAPRRRPRRRAPRRRANTVGCQP